ncbi:MAG: hypothetical protein WD274_09435 [Acidimicrobiia bacterium]
MDSSDLKTAGYARVWRGLRVGDRRDLYLGVTLALISVLRQDSGGKELIYRKKLPEGTALVIHHRRKGDPKIKVIKP